MREAHDSAESKDPYTVCALISAARHSHDGAALGVNTILLTSGLSGRIIRPEFGLSEEQFPNRNAAPPEAKGPRFLGTNPSEKIQRQCSVTSPFATLRTFATERLPMRVRAALLRRPGESDLSAYAEGREIMIQSYRLAKRTILLAALVAVIFVAGIIIVMYHRATNLYKRVLQNEDSNRRRSRRLRRTASRNMAATVRRVPPTMPPMTA